MGCAMEVMGSGGNDVGVRDVFIRVNDREFHPYPADSLSSWQGLFLLEFNLTES